MNDERDHSVADDPARRRLVAGYFVAAVVVAAMVAGIIVVIAGGGNGSPVSSNDPFAPQYQGLEDRRIAAGVPTMAEGGGEHFHPLLEVYVRGEQIPVPANIGIIPPSPRS